MNDNINRTELAVPPEVMVEQLHEFASGDLDDLCDAAEAAIRDGGGFGWLEPPARQVLERFWRGVLLIPERDLFVGRLDGVIAGSCQIVKPPKNNEAQKFVCNLTTSFVAPWARGHGIAQKLIEISENSAKYQGYGVINLDVRATQHTAIRLYEKMGYTKFGEHPHYAQVGNSYVAGQFYFKEL